MVITFCIFYQQLIYIVASFAAQQYRITFRVQFYIAVFIQNIENQLRAWKAKKSSC